VVRRRPGYFAGHRDDVQRKLSLRSRLASTSSDSTRRVQASALPLEFNYEVQHSGIDQHRTFPGKWRVPDVAENGRLARISIRRFRQSRRVELIPSRTLSLSIVGAAKQGAAADVSTRHAPCKPESKASAGLPRS
jgi:hypothetical protein